MRAVPLDIIPADLRRMGLAFEAEAFGVPDPLAQAKAAGFGFTRKAQSHSFTIIFRNATLATFWPELRVQGAFQVWDGFPETSVPGLVALMHQIRDAARTVDSRIKADARAVKGRLDDLRAPAGLLPLAEREMLHTDLFAVHATDPVRAPAVSVLLRSRHGSGGETETQFTLVSHSPLTPRNDVRIPQAFYISNGRVSAQDFPIRMGVLRELVAECVPLYAELAADLPRPAGETLGITQEAVRRVLRGGTFPVPDLPGFSVKADHYHFFLIRDADGFMPILITRRADAAFPGYDILAGTGLPEATQAALANAVARAALGHEAVLRAREAAEAAEIADRVAPPSERLRAAAAAIDAMDFGYRL